MSQIIPIFIPTYISDAEFKPGRVLPRLFYYNGLLESEAWYLESGSLTTQGFTKEQNSFPYFDNYNVVSGSFPTVDSKSLLFNNEAASYGGFPSASLYSQWWEKYVNLLYNPRTRLLNCSAIIPLADYVKMELNDIVNFRGNYYHLRAINDYSLTDGTCQLQLLGPIIPDTFDVVEAPPPPPPDPGYGEVSWSFTETGVDGSFRIFNNTTNIATLTADGSGNARISASNTVTAEISPIAWASGTSMSLDWNGDATISLSTGIDTTLTSSVVITSGSVYYITGSISGSTPPPEACIQIDVSGQKQEEFLDCGVFNLYNEYTASYFEDCVAANAPEDITVYITGSASGAGDDIIYSLLIASGSHFGTEDVYTRIFTGTDCEDRVSETYTITVGPIDPTYPTCSCP